MWPRVPLSTAFLSTMVQGCPVPVFPPARLLSPPWSVAKGTCLQVRPAEAGPSGATKQLCDRGQEASPLCLRI